MGHSAVWWDSRLTILRREMGILMYRMRRCKQQGLRLGRYTDTHFDIKQYYNFDLKFHVLVSLSNYIYLLICPPVVRVYLFNCHGKRELSTSCSAFIMQVGT
jgi:hypothetical protein